MPDTYALYRSMSARPFGKRAFSLLFANKAPYFRTVRPQMRWIPKGMQVSYLAKSTTDLLCIAETDPADWAQLGDVPVRVRAVRTDGTVVVDGIITIYVSERPAR